MTIKYFQRKPINTVPTLDLTETLEQLAQVQQQTSTVLTNTAPEDKNSLNKVLGAVDLYESATETLLHNFNYKTLETDTVNSEIYSQTLTFLMKYVQHRFSATNNPGIWLSTPFLEEYDTVHGKLQEISRKLSPTKAFPRVKQFLTGHDQLLEKYVQELTTQLENVDEALFQDIHALTIISALTGEVKRVQDKLNQYREFTNTYSLVLGETLDDFIEIEASIKEELDFYHRNPSLVEELRQQIGDPSDVNFPAKMETLLDSRRYCKGQLTFDLFVKYKQLLPEMFKAIDEQEKQKTDKVETETNTSDSSYKPVYV